MKKVIGITGRSGSGKSAVSEFFAKRGAYISDADKIAHEILKKGKEAYNETVDCFGKSILTDDGEINRKKLGVLVFSDKEKLLLLNKITHKYIINEIKEEIDSYKDGILIIDAPLLFDTGLNSLCDVTITVTAPENIKVERIMKRDGLTEETARKRLSSQKSDRILSERSDYVIVNDGTLAELEEKILEVVNKL